MVSVEAARVEEVGENRVRLTVDVPADAVAHAVEHAAGDLAQSLRIPGFRKGRVPMPVLTARVGKGRLMEEAVQSHVGGWFRVAASRARLRPVTTPELDYELPESDRAPWTFTATVEVQPKPEVPDWRELEVPRMEPEVPEEAIERELDALRSAIAE